MQKFIRDKKKFIQREVEGQMKAFINLCSTIGTIGIELIQDFFRMMKNGIPIISMILKLGLPYMMYWYGMEKGKPTYWLFLPLVFWFVTIILDRLAEKTGKGKNIPVPAKRFTEEDSDGEVSIEQARLQEMILYVSDIENYLERHHLI